MSSRLTQLSLNMHTDTLWEGGRLMLDSLGQKLCARHNNVRIWDLGKTYREPRVLSKTNEVLNAA